MRLKNFLLVVRDIERSKKFYEELFGLKVMRDFGENVIFSEGLVLQEQKTWEAFIEREVVYGGNNAELYFEENDLDSFLEKLEQCSYNIEFVNQCKKEDWNQRVIRIYDLDKHIIEIGEPMNC